MGSRDFIKYLSLFVGWRQGLSKLFQIVYVLSSVLRFALVTKRLSQIFYNSYILRLQHYKPWLEESALIMSHLFTTRSLPFGDISRQIQFLCLLFNKLKQYSASPNFLYIQKISVQNFSWNFLAEKNPRFWNLGSRRRFLVCQTRWILSFCSFWRANFCKFLDQRFFSPKSAIFWQVFLLFKRAGKWKLSVGFAARFSMGAKLAHNFRLSDRAKMRIWEQYNALQPGVGN